ncbi:MAG: NmrA/HSCARG family protein [Stenomitos rutilans HA7619-LM2]|jgi:uncharacterized protein YbjT (DUF2867 family)|nr:NmrA/HSCARG family protein [Stenomitos rutilans HA7619-LM2]
MSQRHKRILVTGATGTQGSATIAQLLEQGYSARAMTRNPTSEPAKALSEIGVEVVHGDYDNPASLATALEGISGVFSVQVPSLTGDDTEYRHAVALIEAAKRAKIQHFVHTSVSGIDLYKRVLPEQEHLWDRSFWNSKLHIEAAVQAANFPVVTILRPAFLMESLIAPKVNFAFPELRQGELVIAMQPNTKLAMVAAQDIGKFVVTAFNHPDRFNGKQIELAGDQLTIPEAAAVLSRVSRQSVSAVCLTPEAAIARGKHPVMVQHQAWANEVGYPIAIEELQEYEGISLTSFATWVEMNQNAINVN